MANIEVPDAEGASDDDARPFQILCFDGGGLKGLFPAAVLAEVELRLGISIAEHFDLIAGTSTGGLIALALGAGITPAQMVDFYVDKGPDIFGRPRWLRRFWRPKYTPEGLRAALLEVFGDRLLGDSTKRLLIPSYSIDLNDVYVFKTRHHKRLTRDHAELMVDVAMATSAAPTYLPAFPLRNQLLIDGGVWANNPTLIAIAEAKSMLGIPLEDMFVLTIGTTDEVSHLPDGLARGGFAQWARPAVPTLLRAQATGSFHVAEHLIGVDRVVRIEELVAPGRFRLDRIDARRIRGLAEARARHVCPRIEPFTKHIAPPFTPIP